VWLYLFFLSQEERPGIFVDEKVRPISPILKACEFACNVSGTDVRELRPKIESGAFPLTTVRVCSEQSLRPSGVTMHMKLHAAYLLRSTLCSQRVRATSLCMCRNDAILRSSLFPR
jgi:hypothetical protein